MTSLAASRILPQGHECGVLCQRDMYFRCCSRKSNAQSHDKRESIYCVVPCTLVTRLRAVCRVGCACTHRTASTKRKHNYVRLLCFEYDNEAIQLRIDPVKLVSAWLLTPLAKLDQLSL